MIILHILICLGNSECERWHVFCILCTFCLFDDIGSICQFFRYSDTIFISCQNIPFSIRKLIFMFDCFADRSILIDIFLQDSCKLSVFFRLYDFTMITVCDELRDLELSCDDLFQNFLIFDDRCCMSSARPESCNSYSFWFWILSIPTFICKLLPSEWASVPKRIWWHCCIEPIFNNDSIV